MPLPPGLNKERIAEKKLGQIPTGKKTSKITNWIPVIDNRKRPDDLQHVLVIQEFLPDEREINLARYRKDVDGWITSTIGIIHYNITHWQALPKLPKTKVTS